MLHNRSHLGYQTIEFQAKIRSQTTDSTFTMALINHTECTAYPICKVCEFVQRKRTIQEG